MMNYKNIDRISLFILYRPWKATVVCLKLVYNLLSSDDVMLLNLKIYN